MPHCWKSHVVAQLYNILQEGNTPLHIAARDGFTESLFILVAHGADINAKYDVRISLSIQPSVCLSIFLLYVFFFLYACLSIFVCMYHPLIHVHSVCHSHPLPKYLFLSLATQSHTFIGKTMYTRTVNCPVYCCNALFFLKILKISLFHSNTATSHTMSLK